LLDKFRANLARRLSPTAQEAILTLTSDQQKLEATRVDDFVSLFVV
jgi:2-methylcitrate dehydratase